MSNVRYEGNLICFLKLSEKHDQDFFVKCRGLSFHESEKNLKYLRKKLKLKSWQLRVVSHLGQYLNSRKYLFNIWHYCINFTKIQKLIRLFGILSMFIRLENDYKYISFMFLNMHVFETIRIMMNWFHANNTCSKNGWNIFSITNSDISKKFSVNVWLLQFVASPFFK